MHGKTFPIDGVDCASVATAALVRRWLLGSCCGRDGSTVLAHSTVSVVDDYWRSLSAVWDDPIISFAFTFRSLGVFAVSTVRVCCVSVRNDHPCSVGDSENSRSFCGSNTRCGSCCGSRRFLDLEHRVQSDICVICVSSGKRQTPRRTGAFAKQRFADQAATAPCASHSSFAAF